MRFRVAALKGFRFLVATERDEDLPGSVWAIHFGGLPLRLPPEMASR
jgi:hypothetical protein